ncbi:MAG: peptidylprolyl isomerase [Acidimicrobiales bacterium]
MPRPEKRARQKAARAARLAELQKTRKRQANIRRATIIVFLAAIAVGIFALVGGFSNSKATAPTTTVKPATSSTTSTTSTTSSSSTSTTVSAKQATANSVAATAGCPSNPYTKLTKGSWSKPPAMTIDTSKTYLATVKTDVGTFVITLNAKESPIAVNSFVFLAQHDFYNCVIFHRVIPGFVVQGGDPTGTGSGGPGYSYTEEGPPTASPQYPLGAVAMANSNSPSTHDPTTNGSQFFIVTGSSGESLPNDYVLFGQVTSGMSVVNQINNDGSSSGVPPTVTHRMLSVTISDS